MVTFEYPDAGEILDRNGLRYHCLDKGPRDGEPVVMTHGNPSWSYSLSQPDPGAPRRIQGDRAGPHRVWSIREAR